MSFDAIAPHYCWLERLAAGPLLQRCRTQFIHEIKDARNILLLGEGRGRFLIELLKVNPGARITCVDASARMLALTRTELEKRGLLNRALPSNVARTFLSAGSGDFPVAGTDRGTGKSRRPAGLEARAATCVMSGLEALPSLLWFIHADVLSGKVPTGLDRYDAVASHFFLDCFTPEQLWRVCETVTQHTVPGAPWLISDFREPERGWQRVRARWILWLMYRFFRLTTRLPARRLSPPDEPLRRAGFGLRTRQQFNHGLLHSDVWLKV